MSSHSRPVPRNTLPRNAHLDHLKRQARELQRAFANGDVSVRAQVADELPHRVSGEKLSLADAQCCVARGYGFSSWPRLKSHVDWLRGGADDRAEAATRRVNRVGWCHVAELPDYEENLESLQHMLRHEPELVRRHYGEREWTLLHKAANGNGLEVTELLIEHGADPLARTAGGATPLAVALYFGHGKEPLAKRLAEFGPPDNLRAAAGMGRMDRLEALLEPAAEAEASADREVWHRTYDFPERPIPEGRQGVLGDALGYAARSEQLPAMKVLLDKGAPVDSIAYVGTALHWAAFFGRLEAVRLLLAHGAEVDREDDYNPGGTPLSWAHGFGFAEVARLLLEHGARANLPILAAYAPIDRVEEHLAQAGVEVDAPDWLGASPLMNAVRREREDVAHLLLTRGADPDIAFAGEDIPQEGATPRAVAQRKKLRGVLRSIEATAEARRA